MRVVLVFSAVGLLGVAMVVGLADNPPGLLLAFAASVCVVLALTLPWRHPRKASYLTFGSLASFVIAAVLHNVLEAAGTMVGVAWLQSAAQALGVAFFLVAIFLCPAGVVVGIGTAALHVVRRLRNRQH